MRPTAITPERVAEPGGDGSTRRAGNKIEVPNVVRVGMPAADGCREPTCPPSADQEECTSVLDVSWNAARPAPDPRTALAWAVVS